MTRRHLTFSCDGETLAGTLDTAPGTSGLLIVSGGNEVRSGPWSSQTRIAEKCAAAGFPVFRFDRRGVGDSSGENLGFIAAPTDIAAAGQAFRAHVPTLRRVVAFGNCDAASALMLAGGKGCHSLLLANPWTFEPEPESEPEEVQPEPEQAPMPPSALRAHYLRRLTDPRAVWRLLTGRVKVKQLAVSLKEAVQPDEPPGTLATQLVEGIAGFTGPVSFLLAERDRTAQAFRASWDKADPRIRTCPDATHSFVEAQARIWLQGQIFAALRG
jgi:exosortase A-associated hydrolase 1